MQAPWQALLDWWFGDGATAGEVAAQKHRLWFGYRPEQDAEAAERFGSQVDEALGGGLGDWAATPQGWLALILLLDQLPRMIHRGTSQAFYGDTRAQALVRQGLEQGLDSQLPAICRVFPYLVLEHAEDLAQQDEAVARFASLRDQVAADQRAPFDGYLDYAERHRQVIRRFGRFPHRNDTLDRPSTTEELVFLEQPGSRF